MRAHELFFFKISARWRRFAARLACTDSPKTRGLWPRACRARGSRGVALGRSQSRVSTIYHAGASPFVSLRTSQSDGADAGLLIPCEYSSPPVDTRISTISGKSDCLTRKLAIPLTKRNDYPSFQCCRCCFLTMVGAFWQFLQKHRCCRGNTQVPGIISPPSENLHAIPRRRVEHDLCTQENHAPAQPHPRELPSLVNPYLVTPTS